MSISSTALNRLKAAQRDLIDLAGGIERAAEKSGYSKSQAGRWKNALDPDLMPLPAVLALEADTGAALITGVMAELNGRRLVDPDGPGADAAGIFARHAETVRRAGELMATGAAAFADGVVTGTERQLMSRVSSDLQRAVSDLQMALATVRPDGAPERVELKAVE